MSDLRAQIVGLGGVCIMGLFGLAIYSLSYGVTLAAANSRPVPVLEMWMVYTHLLSAAGALAAQALAAGLFGAESGLPHLADALCSLYLGVALAVTCLSSACLGGGVECGIYYPSAIFPAASAVGAIAWSWIMYTGAMGCQQEGGLVQLGIGRNGGTTVAAVMAGVQPQAVDALLRTCMGGTRWDTALQWVPSSVLLSGAALMFAGFLLPAVATAAFGKKVAARAMVLAVSTVLFILDAWLVHSPPAMSSAPFRVCIAVAAVLPWVSMARSVTWARPGKATTPAVAATAAGPPMWKRA